MNYHLKPNPYNLKPCYNDLGKKWFAFSKMDINSFEIIGKLK